MRKLYRTLHVSAPNYVDRGLQSTYQIITLFTRFVLIDINERAALSGFSGS